MSALLDILIYRLRSVSFIRERMSDALTRTRIYLVFELQTFTHYALFRRRITARKGHCIPAAMDGWAGGWMDGWMGGWVGGCHGWMAGRLDGWMAGWMDGWLDGWMAGWLDGWMDGHMNGWMDG